MSTSTERRSRITATTSSIVSPSPRMIPVFVGMSGAMDFASRKICITRSYRPPGRARFQHRANAVDGALKIRNEHLDRTTGHPLVDLTDRLGEDVGAEVGQVVS